MQPRESYRAVKTLLVAGSLLAVGIVVGFVLAGSEYGAGPHPAHLVPAMVALGVRGVIATSFASAHRRELILHGVLPLRPAAEVARGMPGEPGDLSVGDELEFPGLPEMLERNKPPVR